MATALGIVVLLQLASQFAVLTHTSAVSEKTTGRYSTAADGLTRLSAILGIYQALQILHATEQEGLAWLRGPHRATIFGGRPPLALVTDGTQDGLLTVRRFLDAARGGLYMEPNAADLDPRPVDGTSPRVS